MHMHVSAEYSTATAKFDQQNNNTHVHQPMYDRVLLYTVSTSIYVRIYYNRSHMRTLSHTCAAHAVNRDCQMPHASDKPEVVPYMRVGMPLNWYALRTSPPASHLKKSSALCWKCRVRLLYSFISVGVLATSFHCILCNPGARIATYYAKCGACTKKLKYRCVYMVFCVFVVFKLRRSGQCLPIILFGTHRACTSFVNTSSF